MHHTNDINIKIIIFIKKANLKSNKHTHTAQKIKPNSNIGPV